MPTVLLLRHADIDPPPGAAPNNWPLNAAGQARAQTLAHVAGNAGITAIYVSEALRTQQTVAPLATRLNLQPRLTPAPPQLAQEVLAAAAGAVVLIAGHSNTVPEMVAVLGAPWTEPVLPGHDNLLVVTVVGPGQARVVRLKYGRPTP